MNQDLMISLFKAIDGDINDDIVKVAGKIIEEEKLKGHVRLADKLKVILEKNVVSNITFKSELKSILPHGTNIPTDKRNNIPLATEVSRENLRHDMILSEEIEFKINRIEKEYVARQRLSSFGLKPRKKILFYGSPGCGKSMSAERIAWNIGLPFLKVRFEAVISSYLGESAFNLKSLFESVKKSPCVLLLDEFDFIAKNRAGGHDVGEMYRIVNILLNLLEDYEAPGILIATTNLEGTIDKALFRRFDDIIEIPKPSRAEILKLLKNSLSSMMVSKSIDWRMVSLKMDGFSAAMVVKVANDAAKSAIIQNDNIIEMHHLIDALNENNKYVN